MSQFTPVVPFVQLETLPGVFKGKYGYYACDKEIFTKIKKLHSFYWKALRKYAEWCRWNRKESQNRVIKKWLRNSDGQKYAFDIVGTKPEPTKLPIFLYDPRRYIPVGGHILDDLGILEAYRATRYPRKTQEEVKPIKIAAKWLDDQLAAFSQ